MRTIGARQERRGSKRCFYTGPAQAINPELNPFKTESKDHSPPPILMERPVPEEMLPLDEGDVPEGSQEP